MKYILTEDYYLTFLTPQDSYMEKVVKGTIVDVENGNLYYNGKESIDYPSMLIHHKYLKEWKCNPTGDGTGPENR